VRQEYTNIINKLATGSSEFTKAEQETLAIIAYKQPIKQSVIIKIRGNKAYEHIKKFSDLGLIKKKKTGHTHELSLSEDFYDYFNVSESERNNVPGLNKEIDKEIEAAEKEVEEEEAEGKFEDSKQEEENDKNEEESSDKEEKIKEEEVTNNEDKEEYTKGVLSKNKEASVKKVDREEKENRRKDKDKYTRGVLSKKPNEEEEVEENRKNEENEGDNKGKEEFRTGKRCNKRAQKNCRSKQSREGRGGIISSQISLKEDNSFVFYVKIRCN